MPKVEIMLEILQLSISQDGLERIFTLISGTGDGALAIGVNRCSHFRCILLVLCGDRVVVVVEAVAVVTMVVLVV